LFGAGGSKSEPDPLPVYTPPPSVQISDTLRDASTPQAANAIPQVTNAGPQAASATPLMTNAAPQVANAAPQAASAAQQTTNAAPQVANAASQITIHVSAMDSQSFMDRSTDIANAVREAMLNLHPINDVVASL
jgi:hypothetical protein